MSGRLRAGIVPAYLVLCLLLGGASAAGFTANMILQLCALPIIGAALLKGDGSPRTSRETHQLLALSLLAVAIVGFQLVPLPPVIWTALPGREPVVAGFAATGVPAGWMPLSLSPDRTISSLLWLLPCLAAMLGVARLGAFSPKSIAVAVVAVALLSVVIATLQVRSSASRWYFYEISNFGAGTGFFSNANHEGLLLVCGIPFVGALHRTVKGRRRSRSATSGYAAILGGALLILLAGLVLTRSRAAIGLAPAVLVATWLMVRDRSRRLPRWLVPLAALLLIGGAVVALSTPIASRVVAEETKHPEESRVSSFRNSGAAALDFAPVGSGIGTFQLVYGRYEDPLTVTRWYMNHVHNDYLELLLETGLPGLAAILLGLAWWGRRVAACWRDEQRDYAALAATIASAAILAHSLVDYPLRTAAISAIFTICCALLAVPGRRRSGRSLPEGERARHMSV